MNADVIIVGGGIAGLVAALQLKRLGVTYRLLEAQNSVGGRVRTASAGYECGAEFIHGSRAATWSYLDQFSLACDPYPPAGSHSLFAYNGSLLPGPQTEREVAAIVAKLESYRGVEQSVLEYAATLSERDPVAMRFALDKVARLEGADIGRLSARALSRERGMNSAGWDNFRVRGGYSKLVASIEESLDDIVTDSPVTGVAWAGKRVTVTTTTDEHVCRRLLLAVPLTVLQRNLIAFDPPLPRDKQEAISALAMGHVTKVILTFSSDPFPPFSYLYTDGVAQVWWKHQVGAQLFLIGYSGGVAQAERLATLGEEAIARSITELSTLFGNIVRHHIVAAQLIDWANQDWVFGAYSYTPVGAYGARRSLARSLRERLFFAGEAAVVSGPVGTVAGAIQTGVRSADEIAASL